MDRATLDAIAIAVKRSELDTRAAYLKGLVRGMGLVVDAIEDGLVTDEWIKDLRDHLALHEEFSS